MRHTTIRLNRGKSIRDTISLNIAADNPLAVAVVEAIHKGDVSSLKRLLENNPGLATARIVDAKSWNGVSRSLLHIVTDWPGNFPNGAETVVALVEAGADVVVAHMGLTTSGTIGSKTAKTLQDCVREVRSIVAACKSVRDDVIVLCHGGPIARPEDAGFILERVAGVGGFYGASSMERLPTEVAITEQVRAFAELKLPASDAEIVRQSN